MKELIGRSLPVQVGFAAPTVPIAFTNGVALASNADLRAPRNFALGEVAGVV